MALIHFVDLFTFSFQVDFLSSFLIKFQHHATFCIPFYKINVLQNAMVFIQQILGFNMP